LSANEFSVCDFAKQRYEELKDIHDYSAELNSYCAGCMHAYLDVLNFIQKNEEYEKDK
jgi:hypothetical protein